MKPCSRCKRTRRASSFGKGAKTCRDCHNAQTRESHRLYGRSDRRCTPEQMRNRALRAWLTTGKPTPRESRRWTANERALRARLAMRVVRVPAVIAEMQMGGAA